MFTWGKRPAGLAFAWDVTANLAGLRRVFKAGNKHKKLADSF